MSWTQEAEALAADADDLGLAAALIYARARCARVAPEATRGLAGAALTLGTPQAALYAAADPLPADRDLLTAAETLESDAGEMLRAARAIADGAQAEGAAAVRDIEAAHREERKTGTTGATRQAVQAAEHRAADCECAGGIADVLIQRLTYAAGRLGQVPDDLESAYEVPYAHIRRGSVLPHSGDFLTATPTEGAA